MNWYYEAWGDRQGPVSTEELFKLAKRETIKADTLVWKEGMADWAPFAESTKDVQQILDTEESSNDVAVEVPSEAANTALCVVTAKTYPKEEMFQYGEQWVHASQKESFLEQIKESGQAHSDLKFAGFWIRFVAKFIDGIIQTIVTVPVSFLTIGLAAYTGDSANSTPSIMATVIYYLFSFLFPMAYTTWFLGKYSATPGKMALGLKVIEPDDSPINYKRAFGRYWGEMLSSITLCIGYIMVAFDDEKRSLHDRICNTRVVYK